MNKLFLVILLLGVLSLAACSRDAGENRSIGYGWSTADSAPAPTSPPLPSVQDSAIFRATNVYEPVDWSYTYGTDGAVTESEQCSRHIIQTAWTELETEYFDDTVTALRSLPATAYGYVESEQLTTRGRRTFNIVLRIPSANFQYALWHVENLATVRTSSQLAEDVTDQFYDATARLQTRRIEENRLLALIAEAEHVQDLLDLERRLSQTRMQIEMYTAQINDLARRVAYSTIHVTLLDISEKPIEIIAAPTLGNRIGGAFGDSVSSSVNAAQGFVIFLAGIIVPLLIWGIIIFVAYKIVRKIIKKRIVM